jgi:hypothetical protein
MAYKVKGDVVYGVFTAFAVSAWRLLFGVCCLVFVVWCLLFGVCCLVFVAWCLVLGAWCLLFGA